MQLIYRSLLFSFGYALKVPVSTFIFKLLAPVFVPSRPYNILYCNIKNIGGELNGLLWVVKWAPILVTPKPFFKFIF